MKNTTIYTVAAAILLTISANVFADGKDKNKGSDKSDSSSKVKSFIAEKIDSELTLENWMTEMSSFNKVENFAEESLALESWMTESFTIEENFTDAVLVFENWMMSEFDSSNEIDAELEMEEWMTSSSDFSSDSFREEKLQIENWMLKF